MGIPTLAERVSTSFAAWERRGRGWEVATFPVSLEPPFRPFGLLPLPDPALRHLDDGRRPTVLSRFADWIGERFDGSAVRPVSPPPFVEEAAFPAYARADIETRQVLLPHDFRADSRVMAQLLPALAGGCHPFALEVIGSGGSVTLQLAYGVPDAGRVLGTVADFVPEAALVDAGDLLASAWQRGTQNLIVDFGYAEEFLLPLPGVRSFSVDPYAALISACARTGRDETLCFQVLVEKTVNPWHRAIREAVTAPDGKPLFIDAPEFVPAARAKTESFLYAAVVRIGASAVNEYRVLDLIRGTGAFVGQFARPGGNRLVPLDNETYPDQSHEAMLLGRASFRTGMILSEDELLPLLHFPDETVRSEALVRAERRSKLLPAIARGEGIAFGENEHRGQREVVRLGTGERLQHAMIVGASGTGKSKLLANLIRQDVLAGEGVAVLDPHGDLIDEVLSFIPEDRMEDVVLFDPADEHWPIGFNILSADTELERSILASDLVGIFSRLSTSWGDGMSTVLANAVLAVAAHPEGGTLVHLRRFLADEGYRKAFIGEVADPEVAFFWKKEWPLIGARSVGPILTRLNSFLRPKVIRHIVGQRKSKLDLGDVVEDRKIFLAMLSQGLIGAENAYLLGSLLLSKFLQYAHSRQRLPAGERPPFYLYLDEAEHFVTPSVASLLTEARKYGMGLHLAFQMLAQLKASPEVESALFGSAYTRVVFRVGDDDAKKLAEGFSYFTADDLRSLRRGQAIARFGEARSDCNLETSRYEEVPVHIARDRRYEARELSRAQFATSSASLAKELGELLSAPAEPERQSVPEAREPVSKPTVAETITPTLRVTPPESPRVQTNREPPVPEPLGRGGPEHKYLQHLVKRLAEERGFRAVIEEQVEGGQVDVALRRGEVAVACEVSVTTGADHELGNAAKCLNAGFAEVWLVVPDKKRREKLQKLLVEHSSTARCFAVEDLVAALDGLGGAPATSERVVGGYKVRVARKTAPPADAERRESAIAEVIARSLARKRG